MNEYTDKQIDILLNCYFRDHARPTPWPQVAHMMGLSRWAGLDRLLWGIITGYGGNTATGPRRNYTATEHRVGRCGKPWQPREDAALWAALDGAGRQRTPPCDVAYIAAVLGRNKKEVEERWAAIKEPLGRKGFF